MPSFQREDRFFLSGGGALAGFHLAHRETHDLDLFTLEDALDRGMSALGGAARDLGATIEAIQTAPANDDVTPCSAVTRSQMSTESGRRQ